MVKLSETGKRLLVALLTVPILIFSFFSDFLDIGIILTIYVILTGSIASTELLNLTKDEKLKKYPIVSIVVLLSLHLTAFLSKYFNYNYFEIAILIMVTALFIILIIQVFTNNINKVLEIISINFFSFIYPGFLLTFILLVKQEFGPWYLMTFFGISLGGDAGAYFIGKYLGKTKLKIPTSPNKTLEGYIGGVTTAVLASLAFSKLIAPHAYTGFPFDNNILIEILFYFILSLFSFSGDLFESALKRDVGKKDSFIIVKLAGHGGMLDIMDSVLFTFPVAYLLLKIFEKIV